MKIRHRKKHDYRVSVTESVDKKLLVAEAKMGALLMMAKEVVDDLRKTNPTLPTWEVIWELARNDAKRRLESPHS